MHGEQIFFECPGDECFAEHSTHWGIADQAWVCLNCGETFVPADVLRVSDEDMGEVTKQPAQSDYVQMGMFDGPAITGTGID